MDRHECEKLYRGGMSVPDIAARSGQPQSKLRTWKTRYKWERENATPLQTATTLQGSTKPAQNRAKPATDDAGASNSGSNTPHPQARPGNANAVGNRGGLGGPVGNNHRHVHGLHALLTPATLTGAEAEHLTAGDVQSLGELEAAARICDILIARHLNKIAELQRQEKGVQPLTAKMVSVKGIEKGQDSDYVQKELEQSHVYTGELIDRLHGEVAKQVKIKAGLLKEIHAMKSAEGGESDGLIDEWVQGVMSSDGNN